MSNVNDNDIDDLFRRASSQYPLRTDSADWNRLVADLDKDPSLILPPVTEVDRPRRRRLLWLLLLLLPLAGIGYLVLKPSGNGKATIAGSQHVTTNPEPRQDTGAAGDVKTGGAGASERPADISKAGGVAKAGNELKEGKDIKDIKRTDIVKDGGELNKEGSSGEKVPAKKGGDSKITGAAKQEDGLTGTGSLAKDGKLTGAEIAKAEGGLKAQGTGGKDVALRQAGNEKEEGRVKGMRKGNDVKAKNIAGAGKSGGAAKDHLDENTIAATQPSVHTAGIGAPATKGETTITAQRVGLKGRYAVDFPVKAPAAKVEEKKSPTKLAKTKPGFYVGLLAAPDLSTVKMQSIKGTGTTFGVLLGYQFSHRWGIETGLYMDRKKYYTNGEYFDKSKSPRLQTLDVKYLDGVCNMLEIPINVRYNLGTGVGGRTSWFATAGLSTYLMSKEYYKYNASYIGGGPTWDSEWTYRKPSQYWLSIFNLSFGYEQRLGKIGSLRLEPYVRVPLAGVGTGKLPIMSVGLNVGLTRRIW